MLRSIFRSPALRRALALPGGAWLDARLGDPPNRWHPVAGLGHLVQVIEARAPSDPGGRRAYGGMVAFGLPLAAALAAHLEVRALSRVPGGALVAPATYLAMASSQRTLFDRAAEVADALEVSDLETARLLVATHLVSRETSTLDEAGVAAATIESLAENLSDGVVAPWCAFAVAGAPGAWAYRAANTLDAMWGYRDERYEDLGMTAARLDDALNLVPARLTALAILAAARGAGTRTWWRDHGLTDSPNAGHPMSAMAGALGVELSKGGQYVLGGGGRPPDAADIRRGITLARHASLLALAAITAFLLRNAR